MSPWFGTLCLESCQQPAAPLEAIYEASYLLSCWFTPDPSCRCYLFSPSTSTCLHISISLPLPRPAARTFSQAHVFAIFLWIWNGFLLRMCVNKQTATQKTRHQCSQDSRCLSPAIEECLPKALPAPNEIHKAHFTAARRVTKFNVHFMQNEIPPNLSKKGWATLTNPYRYPYPTNTHQGQSGDSFDHFARQLGFLEICK